MAPRDIRIIPSHPSRCFLAPPAPHRPPAPLGQDGKRGRVPGGQGQTAKLAADSAKELSHALRLALRADFAV